MLRHLSVRCSLAATAVITLAGLSTGALPAVADGGHGHGSVEPRSSGDHRGGGRGEHGGQGRHGDEREHGDKGRHGDHEDCDHGTPPTEQPPVENPPDENPPDENPPDENPPDENPPVENPPVENPPVENPPVENPPEEHTVIVSPPEPVSPPAAATPPTRTGTPRLTTHRPAAPPAGVPTVVEAGLPGDAAPSTGDPGGASAPLLLVGLGAGLAGAAVVARRRRPTATGRR